MSKFAKIEYELVVDLILADQSFVDGLQGDWVNVDGENPPVAVGFTYINGVFAPPVVVPEPPESELDVSVPVIMSGPDPVVPVNTPITLNFTVATGGVPDNENGTYYAPINRVSDKIQAEYMQIDFTAGAAESTINITMTGEMTIDLRAITPKPTFNVPDKFNFVVFG